MSLTVEAIADSEEAETAGNAQSGHLKGLVRSRCPLCDGSHSDPETKIAGYQIDKCSDCGFVFMNPRCTVEQLEAIYTVRDEKELIDLYARIATPKVISEYHETLAKIEGSVPGKGKLLDFACAAGYFFEQAQLRGWDAHGCDVGVWAGRAAAVRGLRNMHIGELDSLGFPDESFDVVYAAQVFEHLLNPLQHLKALLRVLKPGGLLYIDVPNYRTLPIMLGRDDFMLNEPPQHINYFTPTTLKKMLQKAGLQSIRIGSGGGLKWENFVGRTISSDIAAAYGLRGEASPVRKPRRPSLLSRVNSSAISMAKSVVVNPVLYGRAKVGINLTSFSIKPPART